MSGTSRHIVLSCQDPLQIRIADCRTDRICIRVFMTDYYGLMLVVLCHIGFLLSAVPPAHYLSIRHIFPNLSLYNPYFSYGQRKQVHRPADSLLPFYIITDFSLLCKTKSCTEYRATTVLFCSVQSAHKNIMYTRVFIIYLHVVHTLFIFFSYTKFIENQQCELIVWSNCT